MANTIIVKRSSVAGKVPVAGDLQIGELAVNLTDKKIYSKDSGGTVVQLGGAGTGDVVGPASASDNALARFDGTTGKLIQNGTVTQDDNGTLGAVNGLSFDTSPTSAPTTVGSMAWDTGDGTPYVILSADTSLQLGQENIAKVYNGTGSTIAKGKVVAVSGAQGQRPSVVLADADTAGSASTLGITSEAIANGAEGFVCTFGLVRGIDTSGFTAGDAIYLSQTAGAFTATHPSAPAHTVFLGWVIKINASSGELFVSINNGWELDELHNVLISSAASGNTLIYDATAGVWKNANLTAGTGITVTNGAGSITVTNSAPDQTVSLTGSGATSIAGTYPSFTISSTNTTYSAATSTTAGLIELASNTQQTIAANAVTATASRTYGLQVNSAGQGVVNVPWTDTTYSLPEATSTTRGGIELFSDTDQSVAANSVTATASRTYGLQLNSAGQGVVNVPWTDTTYTLPEATSTVRGGIELFSNTDQSVAANAVTATAGRTYGLQLNSNGQAVVNVPWTDTNSGGTVTSVGTTGSVNGITLSGTVTTSGNLTLGGTLSGVSLTTQVSGTLPKGNGGTGQTSYTNGQLLIGNTTGNTLSKATLTAGNGITISNGAGSITIASNLVYAADYLIVAGGGGGGSSQGGGGGAGGLISGTQSLIKGTVYSISVGSGGSGNASGNNSSFGTLTAIGGGRGGNATGSSGGSGGGGSAQNSSNAGGSGTSGQGFAGGSGSNPNAGGGGGAGEAGNTDGQRHGGDGVASSITGSSVTYAGGGSGGSNNGASVAGGTGGGGTGTGNTATGGAGTVNTGGGGGGGGSQSGVGNGAGGAGGSGVVIVRVPTSSYTGTTTGSPTVTTSGSNTIIKFTASGSYTA